MTWPELSIVAEQVMEMRLREQATALRPDVLVGHYGKEAEVTGAR
jgi:hypothetical protein